MTEYRAYYYVLSSTGNEKIDKILEAVASAGKRAHYTGDWDDDIVYAIQKAADEAAGNDTVGYNHGQSFID